MLTGRGWWHLMAAGAVALVGVVVGPVAPTVPLLGLALLAEVLYGWAAFHAATAGLGGRLRVGRVVLQNGRPAPSAWAGGRVTVRATVAVTAGPRLPPAVFRDRPPADAPPPTAGRPDGWAVLGAGDELAVEYELRPAGPGVLRFEGVQVQAVDPGGRFYRRAFVRAAAEYLVLPPLTDDRGNARGTKRVNRLPPPGVHRLRRPGGGSELLDLREYRPGDPPKTIAWKPSARRDRLITKAYESDVPVRCVLFVDASASARLGPAGGTPTAKLAAVAAAVAQAAAANRDLVGLSVTDDAGADYLAPARSPAHLIRVLRAVAEAAGRPPVVPLADPVAAAAAADAVAREVYPDLLADDLNSRPLALHWRPLSDSRLLWPVLAVASAPVLLRDRRVVEWVARQAIEWSSPGTAWRWFLALAALPSAAAGLAWAGYGLSGLLPPGRARRGRRKRLAALFALHDGTGPGGVERLLHDDPAFAARAAAFLRAHRAVPPADGPPADGRAKVRALAAALTRAVGRARDNELYVLLADLADLGDAIAPLAAAARMARGRHHQVLVLVWWPADVPAPAAGPPAPADGSLAAVVTAGLAGRYHRSYAQLRTALGRAGATVVRLDDGDPVRRVLDWLDRLRAVGAR